MKKLLSLCLAGITAVSSSLIMSSCTVKDENQLVMATDIDFPPFVYSDKDGNKAGIDIEVAEAIAEKLSMSLKIESTSLTQIIDGVENGKYDFGMAGLTVTEERKLKVIFSHTYASGEQSILVKDGSEYEKTEDFYVGLDDLGHPISTKAGIKIGVKKDTTADKYASADPINWGFGEKNVTRYDSGEDAAKALSNGEITAVIIDSDNANTLRAMHPGLKILDAAYTDEDYAICVGKDNYELLGKINTALEELEAEGKLSEILDRYISN